MGTTVHLVVHGDPSLLGVAQDEVARLEARWSRFLPTSEVSRLNRRAGEAVVVSAETLELVDRACTAARVTEGRFDPTVLGDVLRAGYDRSYEELTAGPTSPASTTAAGPGAASALRRGVDAIEIDRAASTVRLAAGTGFDPGGIGKGLAADLIADAVDGRGAAGVLVNIGGDLRAIGCGPDGDDWSVDLDPAATGEPLATVTLDQGAVATSTVLRRRWEVDGQPRHHLIDPATGAPARTGVVAVSVLAATAWQAEALAKGALLAGPGDGAALVRSLGADALLVADDGGLHATPGLAGFLTRPLQEAAR